MREEKDLKRQQMDSRHAYILTLVANGVDLEQSEVDDAMLEGNQVRTKVNLSIFLTTTPARYNEHVTTLFFVSLKSTVSK